MSRLLTITATRSRRISGLTHEATAFQDQVAACASYDELVQAVRLQLGEARARGYSWLKSIAGYRTGLGRMVRQ